MAQWSSGPVPHCAGSSVGGSDGVPGVPGVPGVWPKSLPTYHGGDGSKHGEESLGRQGHEVSKVSEVEFLGPLGSNNFDRQGADNVGYEISQLLVEQMWGFHGIPTFDIWVFLVLFTKDMRECVQPKL